MPYTKRNSLRRAVMLAGVALATLATTPAFAQDADAEAPAEAQDGFEELGGAIVVTARKREENLQETPISISAFSSEGLAARGVQATDSLATITPNLTLQNNPAFGGSANSAAIYIRGIGQQDFVPTVDPGVGVYVDGVYVARSVGSILDLVDFERIEVLRGPQGTLFGRNTIGGAISITTKAPGSETAGKFSATYGTDDQVAIKGMVNGALTDTLFARASAAYFGRDGYVKRTDGIDLGNSNRLVGRLALRFEPSSSTTFDLAFDGTHARENGAPVTALGFAYGFTRAAPPFADINNVLANVMAGGAMVPCTLDGTPNPGVPGCVDDRYIVGRGKNLGTAPSYSDSDVWGVSLISTFELGGSITLKSITAYRSLDSEFARDGDGTPVRIAQYVDIYRQKQFSQELQLLGESFDGRLNWILGAYYFREWGNNENLLDFTVSRFRSGGEFKNKSLAFFGQGTFEIADGLDLTAGLRYTRDNKEFTPDQEIFENYVAFLPPFDAPFFAPGTPILPNVTARRKFSEVTPMVNLAYRPTPDLMVYGNFSRGFKSGGFTQRVFPPIVYPFTTDEPDPVKQIPSFNPEKVDAYEAGVKFTTGPLQVNIAGFYNDYKDLQIQVFTSVAPVFRNAASATIKGFEAELKLSPGNGWFAEFAVGLTDASYDDIDEATTFVSADNAFERISKWTLSAGLQKEVMFGDGSTLTPRVDWAYRSRFYNDTFNTPQIAQGGYHLVDTNVTWRDADEKWSVTAAVKNVFDKHFLLSGVYGDAFQVYEGVWNRGREASLTVGYAF